MAAVLRVVENCHFYEVHEASEPCSLLKHASDLKCNNSLFPTEVFKPTFQCKGSTTNFMILDIFRWHHLYGYVILNAGAKLRKVLPNKVSYKC
jgi:hypothetical protein